VKIPRRLERIRPTDEQPKRTFQYAKAALAEIKCNKAQRRTIEIALEAYERLSLSMSQVGDAMVYIADDAAPVRKVAICQVVGAAHQSEVDAAMQIYNRVWEEE